MAISLTPIRRKAGICILAVAVVHATGCATGRVPREPQITMPARYDARSQAGLPPATLDAWWQTYGDRQLAILVERALAQGLDARSALARLDEARALRRQADSAFRPQGSLEASADRRQTEPLEGGASESSHTRSLLLPVTWEIDLWGRRTTTRQVAEADLAAARFNYDAARAALAAEVAQTLFEARGLVVQLQDASESARIQSELLRVLRIQAERGITARSQVDRLAGELAQVQAQRLQLESELHGARRALLVLTGDGLAPLESLQLNAQLIDAPPIPATVPADLLLRRPDIREARARIESAAANVRLAELDFSPRLMLRPSLGLSAHQDTASSTTGFWSIAAGLSIPVLDRARLKSALEIQNARGDQALIAYEDAVKSAFSEADRSLAALAADRQRVTVLAQGTGSARRAYEAARIRFDRGLGGLQALLNAELGWRSTRTALTTAQLDALLRSVQVFKALGGGWAAAPNVNPSFDGNAP